MPDAFGNALGYSIAEGSGQTAGNVGSATPAADYSLATNDNGQGLRLGGGQGLVIDGVRATGITENDIRLMEMHNSDSNPYAQLVANSEGEVITAQDLQREQFLRDVSHQIYSNDEANRLTASRAAAMQQDANAASVSSGRRFTDSLPEGSKITLIPSQGSAGSTLGTVEGLPRPLFSNGPFGPLNEVIGPAKSAALSYFDAQGALAYQQGREGALVANGIAQQVVDLLPGSGEEAAVAYVLGPLLSKGIGAGTAVLNGLAGEFRYTALAATDLASAAGRGLYALGETASARLGRFADDLGLAPAFGENSLTAKTTGPGFRPTWRQSELDVGASLEGQGYRTQVSFKDGVEVPYGTKGSTRPEYYQQGSSIEVKNYSVETAAGRNSLVRNITEQARYRADHLPVGTGQSVQIDVRGQNVSRDQLNNMIDRIIQRSNGSMQPQNIKIIR